MWALKQGQILQTGKCGTWNKDEVFTLVNVGPETRVNSADWIMWALKEGWILQTEKCGPWNKVELCRLETLCPETRVKQWGPNHQIILNILLLFYKTFGSYYCMGIVTNAHYTVQYTNAYMYICESSFVQNTYISYQYSATAVTNQMLPMNSAFFDWGGEADFWKISYSLKGTWQRGGFSGVFA
jgi:hypothetical protein